MSDIQRTEAALAKVVAWAEAHPDASWKEGVKNAFDTLTEEMATLERELNEARAERDSLDSITNRLTTETRELCELFRKATGYTVDEYTAMIKEVKAENSETCLGNSAEAKLTPSPDVAGLVKDLNTAALRDAGIGRFTTAERVRKAADALLSLSAQLKEKEAECAGLREDAERYRFLAECDLFGIHYEYGEAQRWLDSRTELDAAIAARKP